MQRCDKSNARTSFGDLKSKLFLGLLFSSILIFRICLSSTSLKEVTLGMYCRMSLLSNSTWMGFVCGTIGFGKKDRNTELYFPVVSATLR